MDYLFWFLTGLTLISLMLPFVYPNHFSHNVFLILKDMAWGIALGIVAVVALSFVPEKVVYKVFKPAPGIRGLLRAIVAGVLFDLCSHGTLFVGVKLYKKGITFPQLVAFFLSSPWNSISLTLILAALIGWGYTLMFIGLSALIAFVSGLILEILFKTGRINKKYYYWQGDTPDFQVSPKTPRLMEGILEGLRDAKPILKWLFFGVIMTAAIRVLVPAEVFTEAFGPSLTGLMFTLLAATVIETCSEGSAPMAADLLNRAGAPGNTFTFLMAGVATDYTEFMILREITGSWRLPLLVPLLSVPQIVVLGYILNTLPL